METSSSTYKKQTLGLASLIFFVVAAASPLTGLVGAMPIAILEGNGAGISGIYIISGLILLIFSVGFIAMSRYIKNAGAFYSYISAGMGIKMGVTGLALAILSYVSIQIAIAAIFGLFTQIFFQEYLGFNLPWWVYTVLMLGVVCWLGIAKIEIGSRVLGILMLLEVGIAVLIAAIVVVKQGSVGALDLKPFTPSVVFNGNVGMALVFTVAAFIGFEATAIYAEECRDPERNVPIATVIAALIIMGFFAFCSWGMIQAYGSDHVQKVVADNPELFVFNIAESVLGGWSVILINILLITSLFAATQSFHNNISRYFYVMARDGIFLPKLAKLHPTKDTPYISSICQTIFMISLTVILALLGQDPLIDIFTWGSAITTMSILLLEILVSISVILYFRRRSELNIPHWKTRYAPFLAAILMSVVLYLVTMNLDILSGIKTKVIYLVPILVFGSAIAGYLYAVILIRFFPSGMSKLNRVVEEA